MILSDSYMVKVESRPAKCQTFIKIILAWHGVSQYCPQCSAATVYMLVEWG